MPTNVFTKPLGNMKHYVSVTSIAFKTVEEIPLKRVVEYYGRASHVTYLDGASSTTFLSSNLATFSFVKSKYTEMKPN